MEAFYGTRISGRISETPEGFLVCHSAPLARTAVRVPQKYTGSELGLPTDDLVDVYRSPREVLSKRFLASLNGKPVCDQHPAQFLTSANTNWYSRGHVQNVRPGPRLPDGEQAVVGDLLITDEGLISKIKSGVRELSIGYVYDLEQREDGTYWQQNLKGNHVAVVPKARGGEHLRIMDGTPAEDFATVCGQYHRVANPNSIAAERDKGLRTADSLSTEMLASGEPRSWDELGADLNERMNYNRAKLKEARRAGAVQGGDEETMAKEKIEIGSEDVNKLIEAINTLTARIEQGGLRRNAEPELEAMAGMGGHPAMDNLRRLRPFIEASGDRKTIDSFNAAVKALKRQAVNLVSAVDSLPRRTRETELEAANAFEASVRRARARMRKEPEPLLPDRPSPFVANDEGHAQESFEDQCRRRGEELRKKKY